MKTFLLLVLAALFLTAAPVGCKSSQERTTFNADKTVAITANAALDAWADYYVAQKRKLEAVGDSASLIKLETQRSQVTKAWSEYQNAAKAIVLAQQAAFTNTTNGTIAQVAVSISAAAAPFIALIKSLIH